MIKINVRNLSSCFTAVPMFLTGEFYGIVIVLAYPKIKNRFFEFQKKQKNTLKTL